MTARTQPAERLLATFAGGGEASVDATIDVRRAVSDAEYQRYKAAERRLRAASINSPYVSLQHDAGEALSAAEDAVSGLVSRKIAPPAGIRTTNRAFQAFLSGFRAFADQTASVVSKSFGRLEHEAFKAVFSEVYDANFAYRLTWALRNIAQHHTVVINWMRQHLREDRPPVADIGVDLSLLLEEGAEAKASIRTEMTSARAPVSVTSLIEAVMHGCEFVQASLLVRHEAELGADLAVLRGYRDESRASGGLPLAFIKTANLETAHGTINAEWVRHDAAAVLEQALPACRVVVDRGAPHVAPDDLYVDLALHN